MLQPTVSAPRRETDPKKRVVITGMGLVSVFGNDIDTFYNKLLEGESGISLIDRFDASNFSVRFAGQIRDFSSNGYIDGKNDRRLDDCWRYCLVAGKKALEDANLGNQVLDTVSQNIYILQLIDHSCYIDHYVDILTSMFHRWTNRKLECWLEQEWED